MQEGQGRGIAQQECTGGQGLVFGPNETTALDAVVANPRDTSLLSAVQQTKLKKIWQLLHHKRVPAQQGD